MNGRLLAGNTSLSTPGAPHGTTSTDDGTSDWYGQAACRGEGTDLWFPQGPHAAEDAELAKAICAACPVKDACLTWALDTNIPDGIFGGLNEKQRRRLKRPKATPRPERTRPECGTPEGLTLHRRIADRFCKACRAYDTQHRRDTFDQKCPGIDAHIDAGCNLDDLAAIYGLAVETIERGLRAANKYKALKTARTNPGREHREAA